MSSSISTPQISSMHRSPLTSHSLDWAREADLVSRIRAGDPQAFETLVGHYGPRMLAVARRLLRCEEDSADAVQEAFLAAHKSIAYFAGHSSLWTWLYRIVVNISLKKMYSRSRRREVPLHNMFAASGRPGRYAPLTARWNETADVCAARGNADPRAVLHQLPARVLSHDPLGPRHPRARHRRSGAAAAPFPRRRQEPVTPSPPGARRACCDPSSASRTQAGTSSAGKVGLSGIFTRIPGIR